MEKSTKTAIIVGVSALVLIGGTIAVIKIAKNRKEKNRGGGDGDDAKIETSDDQTKGDIGKNVKVHPTLGYTNVRSSAAVDDGALGTWFGYRPTAGNWIGEVSSNPVGKVMQALTGTDGHFWYKIQLNKSLDGKTNGYVRQDAVSF